MKKVKKMGLSLLILLISASLVACGQNDKESTNEEEEKTEQVEDVKTEKDDTEKEDKPEISFKEVPVEIDYSKEPEEILANYTEKGMNLFKVNFPDTLTMNYALKHIGQIAPEIEGKTLDGEDVKLSELKGNNVLVSFNKTTCSVCKEMSPIIKEITDDNKDLVVINVFPVDNNEDIKTYYKELDLEVPANTLSFENNEKLKEVTVNEYHIDQVPTYIFVDKEGKISYTYIGNKDKIMFQDMVNRAFGEEKLYDFVRTVTIRVDENGNEIKEEELIEEEVINEDSVDHTKTDVSEEN